MVPLTQLYINGNYVSSSTGDTFEIRNPFSGDLVGKAASASSADAKAAVDAASEAFKTWEHTTHDFRRDIFIRAADLLLSEKYRTKAIKCAAEELSSATFFGFHNVVSGANQFRTQAGMVERLKGEIFLSGTVPGAQIISERRAMGVIFGVAPWNAPITLTVRAVASAIIAGNTIVLKPSEMSPRTQAIIVEVMEEAGLPPGVLNYLPMSREACKTESRCASDDWWGRLEGGFRLGVNESGCPTANLRCLLFLRHLQESHIYRFPHARKYLSLQATPALTAEIIANHLVRCVNFTGSDRVGKVIAAEAAKYLKPCILELGGKAPVVVLNDANIDEAAKGIVFGAMCNSGQICISTERVIVQSGVAEQLIGQVKALCEAIKVGDPSADPSISFGPLCMESSADNVLNMIKEAQAAGAEVILGNVQKERALVLPHLVKNVKPGTRLWDRESFGPVIAFAVDTANASDYTLSASVWTKDIYNGQKIASRIHAGCTNINGPTLHSEPADGLLGLGGASGYGRFHIENFTDKRTIVIHPPIRNYPHFFT